MNITRTSMISGQEHTLDLDVTEEQLQAYAGGMFIQNAFPHLSADQREFIKTGITPYEWENTFG